MKSDHLHMTHAGISLSILYYNGADCRGFWIKGLGRSCGPEGSCRTWPLARDPGGQDHWESPWRELPHGDTGWKDGQSGTGRVRRGKGGGAGPWGRPVSRVWKRQKDGVEQKMRAVSGKCWLRKWGREISLESNTATGDNTTDLERSEIRLCKVISKFLEYYFWP